MSTRGAALRTAILLIPLLVAGCVVSDPLQPYLRSSVASETILLGNDQKGLVGMELPEPVSVKLIDPWGMPVRRQIVNFVVTEGGGWVHGGVAITDENGVARDWWTLGPEPGLNRLELRAVDSVTGEPLVFGTFIATGLRFGENP